MKGLQLEVGPRKPMDFSIILFWKDDVDIATIWIVNCMSWINLYRLRREYNHFKNTITDGGSNATQSKVLSGSYNLILRRKLVLQKHLTVLTICTYLLTESLAPTSSLFAAEGTMPFQYRISYHMSLLAP